MDPAAISEKSPKIERQDSDIVRPFTPINDFDQVKKEVEGTDAGDSNKLLDDKNLLAIKGSNLCVSPKKQSINDFDQVKKEVEGTDAGDSNKLLDDKNQLAIKGSNLCVSPKKQQASGLDKKQVDLFDAAGGVAFEDKHVMLDSIIDTPEKMGNNFPVLNETFIAIGRTRRAEEAIVIIEVQSEATPTSQGTEQMGRTVSALNLINLFISRALLFVKAFCIQFGTHPFTYMVLFEIVLGIILTVLQAREDREQKRQGYSWNCTKIPYHKEEYYCSWTKKPKE